MQTKQTQRTRQLVILAMLCAISYVLTYLSSTFFPPIGLPFLKFDLKDVVITIGGFLFGPLFAFIVSFVVSLLEMVTFSGTGPIGMLMNVLSTCAFCCIAAFIYKKKHTLSGAVIGLVVGAILMTAAMLLWNYLITPLYQGVPREAIAEMLVPIFLPFNLLKAGLSSALTLLLYKPVVTALRKANLVTEGEHTQRGKFSWGAALLGLTILTTVILLALVMNGVI